MRFALILGLLFLFACANQTKEQSKAANTRGELCRYSKYLSIKSIANGFDIYIKNPDEATQKKHVIIRRIPKHLAVMSATHIGMLSALHQEKCISGITDHRLVYSPEVKRMFHQGKIVELNSEFIIPPEKLLKSNAKFLIYSGFLGTFSQEKKLSKLGIQCIPDFDWREEQALGKAEWVLLFGALTGKMKEAQSLFRSIEASYLHRIPALNKNYSEIMISGNVTGDYWYAPAGQSYVTEMFRKSGVNYLYCHTKGTGSLSFSLERIMKDGSKVGLWLNPGFPSKKAIQDANPKAKYLSFFQKGRIYCYTHNLNKYWELSALRPDWIVSDFTQIAAHKQPNYLHFYKEVQ